MQLCINCLNDFQLVFNNSAFLCCYSFYYSLTFNIGCHCFNIYLFSFIIKSYHYITSDILLHFIIIRILIRGISTLTNKQLHLWRIFICIKSHGMVHFALAAGKIAQWLPWNHVQTKAVLILFGAFHSCFSVSYIPVPTLLKFFMYFFH